MFIGGFTAYLVSGSHHLSAWRLAYIAIVFLSLFLVVLRKRLHESPEYLNSVIELKQSFRQTLALLFSAHKARMLCIVAIAVFMNVYIYTASVYFMSFMVSYGGYTLGKASLIVSIIQGLTTLCIPIAELIAERVHYQKMMKFFILQMCCATPLLFYSASHHHTVLLFVGLLLYLVANAWISATVFYFTCNQLPVRVRCTGTSVSWSLSAALFGGTAPMLAAFLVDRGLTYMPSVYVLIVGIFAWLAIRYSQA